MRRSSDSNHAQFFASLNRLEKRLKRESNPSENSTATVSTTESPSRNDESIGARVQYTDSLGTPLYLNCSKFPGKLHENGVTPQLFMPISQEFPSTQKKVPQVEETETSYTLNLEKLIDLLKLRDSEEFEGFRNKGGDDGFHRKIVGYKGPKNAIEAGRLEGWIKHFMENGKEPFALPLLLLGKSALLQQANACCNGLTFPSAIDEFLQVDPLPIRD